MLNASTEIVAKGMRIAGQLLEADTADLEFADGQFSVKGTDRAIGIFEVARAARDANDLPDDWRGPLAAASDEMVNLASFPTAAMSARSRSMPRRVRSRSSGTLRSTIAANR